MEDLKKVKLKRARVVADNLKLSAQALELLEQYEESEDFICVLIEHQLWLDALAYLAYVLPVREGIWWACLAARDSLNELSESDQHLVAIEAAEKWVYQPNEQNRNHAMKLSRAFKQPSQAQVIVLAIDLSGSENESSPNLDAACSSLIAGSITISALQEGAGSIDERYSHYLEQGVDIAKGGNGKINRSE